MKFLAQRLDETTHRNFEQTFKAELMDSLVVLDIEVENMTKEAMRFMFTKQEWAELLFELAQAIPYKPKLHDRSASAVHMQILKHAWQAYNRSNFTDEQLDLLIAASAHTWEFLRVLDPGSIMTSAIGAKLRDFEDIKERRQRR